MRGREKGETYGSRDISTGHTLDGRIEVVERVAFDDLRADLGADAERGEAAFDCDESTHVIVSTSYRLSAREERSVGEQGRRKGSEGLVKIRIFYEV